MSETVDDADDTPAVYARGDAAEDVWELLRYIEETHPDPFVGYESRVTLHARVERLVRSLSEESSAEEFYRRVAPVVAGLDDAHSLLHPPDDASAPDGGDRTLPVSFRIVGDELYVEEVTDDTLTDLLGGRLRAVEGVPVPELVERGRGLRTAENRYGALARTGHLLERYRPLARLLNRVNPPAEPELAVEVADSERRRSVTPVAEKQAPAAELKTTLQHPTGEGPRYRHYRGGDVTVFVPGNLSDYRESLEAKHAAAADVTRRLAAEAYDRQVGEDPPDDIEETIAALPSMTATLETMAEEMAAAGTETLIVDLRDNPGGDSQFVFHLAYALEGWDGVARTTEQVRLVRRRTEPYRRRYGGGGAGDASPDPDNPYGYDFSGFIESGTGTAGTGHVPVVRQRLRQSPTATEFVERVDEKGLYSPEQLVVVVSAGTMSSAFAGAAQLTSLDAEVVGVPPGQSPVSFGEHVERQLPNTGLDVRLAGSMYHWLADPEGDILEPDCELTPARFEQYGCADDAGLRLAFEHAGYGSEPREPDSSGGS